MSSADNLKEKAGDDAVKNKDTSDRDEKETLKDDRSKEKPSESEPESEAGAGAATGTGGGASEITTVDALRKYLQKKLSFTDKEADDQPKILDSFDLDGIVKYIKDNDCENIITMAGAGISTSAGIPDFRSPKVGLYNNLQKYNLPHPQAIFELDFFHENPRPFFELAKELYPGAFKPTICHYFIRLLIEKGMLLRHYTQNIDTLERVAGIPGDKLVEAHGTFHTGHCVACKKEYTLEWMKERIFKDETPICEKCPGVVKPDIVFFGENLPDKFYKLMKKDFPKCDLLIVMGSSLAVQPFASLITRVKSTCPRLLINREKAGNSSGLFAMIGFGGGLEYDLKSNVRDVCWLGDCDDGCLELAKKLGFGDELLELVEREHKKTDGSGTGTDTSTSSSQETGAGNKL